jgi:hypothetical protein
VIAPYLKSIDVLGCPSNPKNRPIPGKPARDYNSSQPGDNAFGWEVEPGQQMPISYAMNACATTWVPAACKNPTPGPPLRAAQVVRPADTILICESVASPVDIHAGWIWGACGQFFVHAIGKASNFISFDGHVKSKKWLDTLYRLPGTTGICVPI